MRAKKHARSLQEIIPGSALKRLPGFRTSSAGGLGALGKERAGRLAKRLREQPGGPPGQPCLGSPRTPRDPTWGGRARPHAPKAREQPLAASRRSASGGTPLPRTIYGRQPDPSQGPGRAAPQTPRLHGIPSLGSTPPSSWTSGGCARPGHGKPARPSLT